MIEIIIACGIPLLMVIGWLIHIAVCWHWDFNTWFHDSDDDFLI